MRTSLRLIVAGSLIVIVAASVAASATARKEGTKRQSALRSVVYRAAADNLGMTLRELRRTRRSGQSLVEIAGARGTTAAAFKSVLVRATEDWVARRTLSGELTKARSRQVLAAARAEVDALVRQRPAVGSRGGPDLGKVLTSAAATYLDLTPDEIAGKLHAGRPLGTVAAAQKRSAAGLKFAMWNAVRFKLDRRVAAGTLEGSKQSKLLARAERKIARLVARAA